MNKEKDLLKNIKINSAGKTYCAPDWSWDTGTHDWQDYDLWTVIEGEGKLKTPKKEYNIFSGDCFLLRNQQRYVGHHNPENPLVVIHIHFNFFDGEFPKSLKDKIPSLYRRIKDFSFFEGILERILNLYQNNKIIEASKWLEAALREIIRQQRQNKYTGLKLKQKSLIDEIAEKIKKNPDVYQNVEDMTDNISYSKDHFLRLFKKYQGETPHEYLIKCRIASAKSLLLASSHNISRIAELLGYNDVYHFSKQFKNRTGVSPSEYRKDYLFLNSLYVYSIIFPIPINLQ